MLVLAIRVKGHEKSWRGVAGVKSWVIASRQFGTAPSSLAGGAKRLTCLVDQFSPVMSEIGASALNQASRQASV